MNWSEITKAVSLWLVENTIGNIDIPTIQKVFQVGLDKLKEAANKTPNPIDNWAIGQVENYLQDEAKLEQIRQFILDKLRRALASAEGSTDPYYELAVALEGPKCEGECGSALGNVIIEKILFYIIQAVIEYFTEKGNAEN